jgi:hypothetical protein
VTAADRLAALVRAAAGIELPVRVRAWDGSESGPVGGPVLIIRKRRALRRLQHYREFDDPPASFDAGQILSRKP